MCAFPLIPSALPLWCVTGARIRRPAAELKTYVSKRAVHHYNSNFLANNGFV